MMVKPPPRNPSLLVVCFCTSVQPSSSESPPMPPNRRSSAPLTGRSAGAAASKPPLIQASWPKPALDSCSAAARDLHVKWEPQRKLQLEAIQTERRKLSPSACIAAHQPFFWDILRVTHSGNASLANVTTSSGCSLLGWRGGEISYLRPFWQPRMILDSLGTLATTSRMKPGLGFMWVPPIHQPPIPKAVAFFRKAAGLTSSSGT